MCGGVWGVGVCVCVCICFVLFCFSLVFYSLCFNLNITTPHSLCKPKTIKNFSTVELVTHILISCNIFLKVSGLTTIAFSRLRAISIADNI